MIYDNPHGSIENRRHEEVSREMIALAEETVWGSGGTRYKVRDIEAKLKRIVEPSFITLHVNEQLAGKSLLPYISDVGPRLIAVCLKIG